MTLLEGRLQATTSGDGEPAAAIFAAAEDDFAAATVAAAVRLVCWTVLLFCCAATAVLLLCDWPVLYFQRTYYNDYFIPDDRWRKCWHTICLCRLISPRGELRVQLSSRNSTG